jgi:HAD superfamily hydrolase (TIGR01509 family)
MQVLEAPRAVIFDMDGLIFDTETLYQESLRAVVADGYQGVDDHPCRATVGLPLSGVRALLAEHLPPAMQVEELIATWSRKYEELAQKGLRLKPGMIELLDALDERGIPTAIATGSDRQTALRHLADHGLAYRFKVVIADDDCSKGKPNPEPFVRAAEALGVPPTACWALEDSRNGVKAAHAAGMMTIMVPDLVQPDAVIEGCVLQSNSTFMVSATACGATRYSVSLGWRLWASGRSFPARRVPR